MMSCAACGKSGEGLKKCTACKSVLYCDVDCQRSHRKAHKKACKQKAAELHSAAAAADTKFTDDELFADPPPREICPICSTPLPLNPGEATYHPCCGKVICNGCDYECIRVMVETNASRTIANATRDADSKLPMLEECCAFCRATYPDDGAISELELERMRKRMEANDAWAFYQMAGLYRDGIDGFPVDSRRAFEHMSRAADLGLVFAHYNLGCYYNEGIGVERDKAKHFHYFRSAAKKGHIDARFFLGQDEANRGNIVLAVKHWLISAAAGEEKSMANINKAFQRGLVSRKVLSKELYAKTLRAHQDAHDQIKSDARDAAKKKLRPSNK